MGDFFVSGLAGLIDAVGVVKLWGAVDAQADEEVIFDKELAPLVVEQGAVGLDGVGDFFAVGVFFLQFDGFAEEGDAEKGGLAALPGEGDFGDVLVGDVLTDERVEDFVAHPEFFVGGEEFFFFEIEAVFAVEIAQGANGFGHYVERMIALRVHFSK